MDESVEEDRYRFIKQYKSVSEYLPDRCIEDVVNSSISSSNWFNSFRMSSTEYWFAIKKLVKMLIWLRDEDSLQKLRDLTMKFGSGYLFMRYSGSHTKHKLVGDFPIHLLRQSPNAIGSSIYWKDCGSSVFLAKAIKKSEKEAVRDCSHLVEFCLVLGKKINFCNTISSEESGCYRRLKISLPLLSNSLMEYMGLHWIKKKSKSRRHAVIFIKSRLMTHHQAAICFFLQNLTNFVKSLKVGMKNYMLLQSMQAARGEKKPLYIIQEKDDRYSRIVGKSNKPDHSVHVNVEIKLGRLVDFGLRVHSRLANQKQCGFCNAKEDREPTGLRFFRKCGGCKNINYCSRKCQKIHWKALHRHKCLKEK